MKKIIFITVIIVFIPFLIVNFYKIDEKEEIKIKYMLIKKLLKHKQWRREVMHLKEWSIIKIMIMMLLILL